MKNDENYRSQGTIVVLTDEYIDYPKLVIDNIATVLNEKGYGLLCIAGRELSQGHKKDKAVEACNAIYTLANSQEIKGLISISGSIGYSVDIATLDNFLAQYKIPKISLNASTSGIPSVLIDDLAGMQHLMSHLLRDENRQHIAFIRGYPKDPYSLRRETIFREMMVKHNRNIDESLIIEGNYDKFETYNAVTEFLGREKPVDAIVAANDLMALSAARAISAKGLRIPQDIAVTGFDDTREATQNSPALTTVRQPIDTIATSCTDLLLETIDMFSQEIDRTATHAPDDVIVDNELITRGSTMSNSHTEQAAVVCTEDGICENLQLSLTGLGLPRDVTIPKITQVYWNTITYGSKQLYDYIEQHMDTSIKFEHIHWWSNLCHQLEYHTEQLCQHLGEMQHAPLIIAILAQVRERVWSVSLDHEFKVHRLEIVQKRMQLQMSSCTRSDEILIVLAEWLETLGANRSFLVQFDSAAQHPSEYATLIHTYRDGRVETCTDEYFKSKNLLPTSLQKELGRGFLIMCPVHAGDKLFGYFLIDPTGLEHLDLESTSNSIGNAMRNHYLIQTLEKQATSLLSANRELYTLAQYDALTGLPNRLNFQHRLTRQCELSLDSKKQFALLFIDLDGFKHINDTLGHDAGDRLLQAVGQRLENLVASLPLEHIFIARLGGDEFTIIVDRAGCEIEISKLIEKVLESLRNTFAIGNQTLTVSGSVGCAFFPDNGTNAESLVKHADTAMYNAKARGKNCMAFFTPEMSAVDSLFLRLDQEMRAAICNKEFQLYFQPKINLESGLICGVEALMRWIADSSKGMQFHSMPDEFIPIAESTGFITQLDLYAVNQACRIAREWELNGRTLPVAVNMSVVLLQKDNFVELISDILDRTQLTPSLLEFEITESAVMTQVENNVGKLGQLRDMGIRISIDDFGTGYSSLSYLKKLPINSLKIDRSFISDLGSTNNDETVDAAIVRSVVALGKSLGLILIAEGVETKVQMDTVQQIGCEQAQGYLFAKPLPLNELEIFLENNVVFDKVA